MGRIPLRRVRVNTPPFYALLHMSTRSASLAFATPAATPSRVAHAIDLVVARNAGRRGANTQLDC